MPVYGQLGIYALNKLRNDITLEIVITVNCKLINLLYNLWKTKF